MSQRAQEPRTRILVYLLCTFGLSSIFYTLIIRDGHLGAAHGLYVFALMWCPGVSAIITSLLLGRPLRAIGWSWSWKYQGASYIIPIAYATIAYAVVWSLGYGGVPNWATVDKSMAGWHLTLSRPASLVAYIAICLTVGMVTSCVSALGEEIGWRGFLVPEVAKIGSYTTTALLTGAIWAAWHVPILLFADYNNGTPAWYGLTCFAVMVIGINFAFVWMRLRSGSVWTGMFLHASHNMIIQAVLTPLTIDTGKTKWVIDEFGCALAIAAIVVAFLFWRKRHDVEILRRDLSFADAVRSPLMSSSAREPALRADASGAVPPPASAG